MRVTIQNPEIVFWPHTLDYNVASFRIRCQMVCEGLHLLGLKTDILDSDELGVLDYQPSILVLTKRVDVASLKQALEHKRQYGTYLILDECDSIFPVTKLEKNLDNKLPVHLHDGIDPRIELIRQFDHIITPTSYLLDLYRQNIGEGPEYTIIDDVAEKYSVSTLSDRLNYPKRHLLAWNLKRKLAQSQIKKGRRLLWYGVDGSNWGNGMADIAQLSNVLSEHNAEEKLSLSIVSNNANTYRNLFGKVPFETNYLRWHYSTFGQIIEMHDIVLIPIEKNNYSLGKSANRITTAFNNGLAVAATLIPSYENFQGIAVFDDWGDGLGQLMADSEVQLKQIAAAKHIVEKEYDRAVISNKWANLLASSRTNRN